jgi:hypothetical protein
VAATNGHAPSWLLSAQQLLKKVLGSQDEGDAVVSHTAQRHHHLQCHTVHLLQLAAAIKRASTWHSLPPPLRTLNHTF